jgi:hypothetical protein
LAINRRRDHPDQGDEGNIVIRIYSGECWHSPSSGDNFAVLNIFQIVFAIVNTTVFVS